jgi:murein hydrolase activator
MGKKGVSSGRRRDVNRTLLLCGLLLLWVTALTPPATHAARAAAQKDLSQKRRDLTDVRKEITRTKEKEKETRGKETSVLDTLHRMDVDLDRKERDLRQMERRLVDVQEKLGQTRAQIARLNQDLDRTREELARRFTALYKMGRVSPVSFFFTSNSYSDLLRTDKSLRVIIDSDARLMDTYRRQATLKRQYQDRLSRDQVRWQQAIAEVERKKEETRKARESKQDLLKSIQSQKAVYQKVIVELEGRARELQSLIDRLERERSPAAPPARARPEARGTLGPPVQGTVISHFRDRGQNGIEIQAPAGAQVRAILPGKVLYADWFKGFGNMVIIDHGGGTFTVSGYCSELLKKAGDAVAQGEPVALVGSAGSLKGPCLYFEVRSQGRPQDPMAWIASPEKVASGPEVQGKGRRGP